MCEESEFATYEELVEKKMKVINGQLDLIFQYGKRIEPIRLDKIADSQIFMLEILNQSLTYIIDNDMINRTGEIPYFKRINKISVIPNANKDLINNARTLVGIVKDHKMSIKSIDNLSLFEASVVSSSISFLISRMKLQHSSTA